MQDSYRIYSIDVMRGLTLILMLFINDLNMPGSLSWLGQMPGDINGMGLADLVFPGFLFIVGMAIPFSVSKRIYEGQNNKSIARHIIIRTISLLIIGLLMLNSERVNPEFTGIGKNLWTLLMYTGVFLIWNRYQENDKNFFTIAGLKLAGIAILVVLVYKFRSGEFENNGSLITGWWGFPGLIGWGYLVAALIYLAIRNNILNTIVAILFFLTLNILSNLNLLSSLNSVKPIFGVIIEGNVPMIVLSGVLTALILKRYSSSDPRKIIVTIVTIGVLSIIAGFILNNWFIISRTQATPGWGLICIGINMNLFALLYWIIDIKNHTRWTFFFKPAGENSLTAYLLPEILYSLILTTGIPVLFYKESGEPLLAISGSLIWAILIVRLTALLVRFKINLKL